MAGYVTTNERRLARRMALDFAETTARGVDAAQQIGWRAMLAASRAWRGGDDPAAAALRELAALGPLLRSAMVVAVLDGIWRGRRMAPRALSLAVSDVYRGAVASLRQRLGLPVEAIRILEARLSTHALRIAQDASEMVEAKLGGAMRRIAAEGLHVRAGTEALREAFAAAGIVPANSFTLEGIYRTQTALAYAAGKVQVERSAESDEILWGYKYVTVGDDRVRNTHAAIDATTLPKEHGFWNENYPPNGFACRCQVIPIYEPRRIVEPPDSVEIDGKIVVPGADEGFRFNPGSLIDVPGFATIGG